MYDKRAGDKNSSGANRAAGFGTVPFDLHGASMGVYFPGSPAWEARETLTDKISDYFNTQLDSWKTTGKLLIVIAVALVIIIRS